MQRRLAGVVIHGALRDSAEIRGLAFPAFSSLVTMAAGDPKGMGMIGVSLRIGETPVRPGDWIVGDGDGVVCIPQERAVEIANRALAVVEREERELAEIEAGSTLAEVGELLRWEQQRRRDRRTTEGET
jgi:3-hexulose-6-phosphate synthase/6-phospho-3-hexuloisomerase